LPLSCPFGTKKPIAQRRNVETIVFLKLHYLTASLKFEENAIDNDRKKPYKITIQ
jgi:hypothetical protein